MSGVVFKVHEKSPHREGTKGPLYFCCESCAEYFSQNKADIESARRMQ